MLNEVVNKFKEIFKQPKPKGEWYLEGEEAYYAGKGPQSCPYKMSWQQKEWMDGYMGVSYD